MRKYMIFGVQKKVIYMVILMDQIIDLKIMTKTLLEI